jgi:hypothetical protein
MNSCHGTGKPFTRAIIPSKPDYARASLRMLTHHQTPGLNTQDIKTTLSTPYQKSPKKPRKPTLNRTKPPLNTLKQHKKNQNKQKTPRLKNGGLLPIRLKLKN